jgi:hypothetical protein
VDENPFKILGGWLLACTVVLGIASLVFIIEAWLRS